MVLTHIPGGRSDCGGCTMTGRRCGACVECEIDPGIRDGGRGGPLGSLVLYGSGGGGGCAPMGGTARVTRPADSTAPRTLDQLA